MKITRKLLENGNIIGYEVDDSGLIMVVLSKCLYTEVYLPELVKAGYKVFDYNPDNIEAPNGTKISDLPGAEWEVDEDERFALEELADSALTDAECTRYYSYHSEHTITFLEPDSSDIIIHSREELIDYLETVKGLIDQNGYSADVRPLNAITSPEALFTCDEIYSDSKIRVLFETCAKRHSLRDWTSYEYLVDWLFEKGVIKTREPSYTEFLSGYYAWGVDGVKDSCVSMNVKQAVDGPFKIFTESLDSSTHLSNRDQRLILWDKHYTAHYLRQSTDMSDTTEFGREPITLYSNGELFKMKRGASSWGADARLQKGFVSRVNDRLYFGFLSEHGYQFQIRVTHSQLALFAGQQLSIYCSNFSIGSVRRDISYTLDNVRTSSDYYLWNLALGKAVDILKQRNIPVPVKSTYEMLINEGIGPKAAIDFIVNDLVYSTEYRSTASYKDDAGKRPNYANAFDYYCGQVPKNVLEKYGVTEDSYDSMDEFIDMAVDSSVDYADELMNSKGLAAKQQTISMLSNPQEAQVDPKEFLDSVTFVRSVLNNEVTINAFGDGKIADTQAALTEIIGVIMTCVYYKLDSNSRLSVLSDYIINFEKTAPFDIDKVFKLRDAAYKGYVKDLTFVRGRRAYNAWAWMYCTKVYRELSNAPADKQRHYIMETIKVEDKALRRELRDCVLASAEKYLDSKDELTLIKNEAYWIAANIFYLILTGSIDKSCLSGNLYTKEVPTGFGNTFKLELPITTYEKVKNFSVSDNLCYITLYDYCNYEFSSNGAFSMFMVNADVTPWRVTPKKGFSIDSVNFMVNYNRLAAFDKFSDEWKNGLMVSKGKVGIDLIDVQSNRFIPNPAVLGEVPNPKDYDIDTIDTFLDARCQETIHLYKQRWLLRNNAAKDSGDVLETMPLKSDILWSALSKYFGEEEVTEDIYSSLEDAKSNKYLATVERVMCKPKAFIDGRFQLTSSNVTREMFLPSNYEFHEFFSWTKLLEGHFSPSRIIFVNSTALVITDAGSKPEIVPYNNITISVLESFARANICYQLSSTEFLFKAFNGDYVLEAK